MYLGYIHSKFSQHFFSFFFYFLFCLIFAYMVLNLNVVLENLFGRVGELYTLGTESGETTSLENF